MKFWWSDRYLAHGRRGWVRVITKKLSRRATTLLIRIKIEDTKLHCVNTEIMFKIYFANFVKRLEWLEMSDHKRVLPSLRKMRMRRFFDVSKVKESTFFSDLADPPQIFDVHLLENSILSTSSFHFSVYILKKVAMFSDLAMSQRWSVIFCATRCGRVNRSGVWRLISMI